LVRKRRFAVDRKTWWCGDGAGTSSNGVGRGECEACSGPRDSRHLLPELFDSTLSEVCIAGLAKRSDIRCVLSSAMSLPRMVLYLPSEHFPWHRRLPWHTHYLVNTTSSYHAQLAPAREPPESTTLRTSLVAHKPARFLSTLHHPPSSSSLTLVLRLRLPQSLTQLNLLQQPTPISRRRRCTITSHRRWRRARRRWRSTTRWRHRRRWRCTSREPTWHGRRRWRRRWPC